MKIQTTRNESISLEELLRPKEFAQRLCIVMSDEFLKKNVPRSRRNLRIAQLTVYAIFKFIIFSYSLQIFKPLFYSLKLLEVGGNRDRQALG